MSSIAAASSAASEREDRVFTAAFGIMDSSQEGEAVAAFLRVRELLRRHDGGFRHLLERCEEAERLNEELGRQNAALLRENATLRARDSRPIPPPSTDDRRLPFASGAFGIRRGGVWRRGFWHWDLGLMVIIAVWAAFGLLAAATAFALAAAVLICAAFIHWFSPVRFFAGALLALAAYATAAPDPAGPTRPTASAHAVADAQRSPPAVATPAATVPAATMPPAIAAPPQVFPPHHLHVAVDPSHQPPADPRSRHAAKVDCGAYQLQPGFSCARGSQWRRDSFLDFEPSLGMRSD